MNAKFKIIILIKKYLKNVLLKEIVMIQKINMKGNELIMKDMVMEYAIIQKEIIMGNGKMTKKKV